MISRGCVCTSMFNRPPSQGGFGRHLELYTLNGLIVAVVHILGICSTRIEPAVSVGAALKNRMHAKRKGGPVTWAELPCRRVWNTLVVTRGHNIHAGILLGFCMHTHPNMTKAQSHA